MSSGTPIIRQTAWISLIPQLFFLALIMLIWYLAGYENEFYFNGLLTYMVLSFGLRFIVPRSQRRGMILVRNGLYEEAIPFFEASYDFFKKYEWMDKFRYLVLLNSSRISYREMALVNMAFCYAQEGDGQTARAYYERTLQEFPGSKMATTALKMMDAAAQE